MRLAPAVAIAGVIAVSPGAAQTNRGDQLVAQATAYVVDFLDRFSNVVAEERYEQQTTVPKRSRLLMSDFLLVKAPGDEVWQSFRDVAEVDGKPVRDREDRLTKLFLRPSSSTFRRAAEIRDAGARYNLTDIGTLSNPLLVIAFLQEQYVDRFRFNLAGLDKKLGPDVRTVRFVEFRRPTVLKLNANGDLFSRGLIWVEEGSGRVVKTELQVGGQVAPVRVTTLFTFDEELGINVFYGGHYATETFGVKALAAQLARRFKLRWDFIDHPTGL